MYNAIVLAGGVSKNLSADHVRTYEAFIDIGGKPMLYFVLKALLQSEKIDKIIIAGPMKMLAEVDLPENVKLVQSGETILDTVVNGIAALDSLEKTLIVTVDVPFITAAAIDDFLMQCQAEEGDFYYPIIEKSVCEVKFPQGKRTYVKLSDGTFTGGNIFLVKPEIIPHCMRIAKQIIANRKKPWRLASLLGWITLLKFVFGYLSVKAAKERVSKILAMQGVVIISDYPEIGMDVDKLSDVILVEQYLVK
ncbi:MAG: cofC [Massilibacillus sp.]|jgi:GTP:adenosylcobinamide-phosphate guanylyltransferase|nr:cofC [Massilibacillus sp.]